MMFADPIDIETHFFGAFDLFENLTKSDSKTDQQTRVGIRLCFCESR